MTYDIDVIKYDPLAVFITFAMPYPFILLFQAFYDPVGYRAQLYIGLGGCQHKEVRDRGEFSQVQDKDIFGAAFRGKFSTQPGVLLPDRDTGCAARAAFGGG